MGYFLININTNFVIVVPLSRQLSWSRFIILIQIKNQDARMFYTQKAMESSWSNRELRPKIERKTFELNYRFFEICNPKVKFIEFIIQNIFKLQLTTYFLKL